MEHKLPTTPEAMKQVFGSMPRCRMAMETGTHSPWVIRLLTALGNEVIVAHAQKVRLITKSRRKDDRLDARTLARLTRIGLLMEGTYCRDLPPTRRSVAAATEEAGQAEQVAEVVPSSVVVELVDTEVAFEQRNHKDERRNKALPKPKPEARDHVLFARGSFEQVRSRSTSSQNVQQQQDKHKEGQ